MTTTITKLHFENWVNFYALTWREKETIKLYSYLARKYLSSNIYHAFFFSRELPLVVAKFFCVWRFCHLRFGLFRLLLLYKIRHWWIRAHPPLLYLHAHDGGDFLASDRHYWFLCSLFLYQENLRSRKNWLKIQTFNYYWPTIWVFTE